MENRTPLLSSVYVRLPWHRRFAQQFVALFWKNVLQAWRSWKTTTVRLAAPFIFLLLVWLIDKALQGDEATLEELRVRRNPDAEPVGPIPRCEDDMYVDGDCLSFFYSVRSLGDVAHEDAKTAVDGIVHHLRQRNDPPIPSDRVRYLDTPEDVNQWFLQHPDRALGAVLFEVSNDLKWIDFTLQTNSTPKYFKREFQDPNFFFQLPLQSAVQRAIAVYQLNATGKLAPGGDIGWELSYKDWPHPAFESQSVAGALMGPFLFAANMFGVVTQMSAMAGEKQDGMRQSLRTMGMLDSAYWASWAAWEVSLNFCTSLLNIAIGCVFQFKFFLDNSFLLVFLLLFLFQLSMVGLGFFLSALTTRVVLATLFGFVIFVVGWITYAIQQFGIPYTSEYFKRMMYLTVILTAMPWNVFMKGVDDLSAATANTESHGLSFSQRYDYCRDTDGEDSCETEAANIHDYLDCECVLPLGDLYWLLFLLFLGYTFLAIYVDKVLPNEQGVALHPLFFLDPRYWGFKAEIFFKRRFRTVPLAYEKDEDPDVLQEMEKMKASMDEAGQPISDDRPVELYGLQKRYGPKFFAITGSWFSIDEGELFCLLGPNGAGKTTTINCLTGVLPPSGGEAFLYGHSITEPGGMDQIRSMMGVCPQFDVLWKTLTAMEHLWIFGSVKGIPQQRVLEESAALLEQVALTEAAHQRAGTFSGGMKRRLSVAIALLGDPKIVFLDEPTTGMDPISRRYVWDIIESAKPGRAIVLTTHSMDEADILGDRICIMARGDVRALGSSIRLKQKFGAGYSIAVSVKDGSSADLEGVEAGAVAKRFFEDTIGLRPKEENRAYITFLVPREKETRLANFLRQLEERREDLGVGDINISLTTLEEVFLNIARTAEIEALRAEGTSVMRIPFTDGSRVEIQVGQERFVHAATGVAYVVHWGQTDTGTLQITDAVPEGDVPEGTPDPNLSLL